MTLEHQTPGLIDGPHDAALGEGPFEHPDGGQRADNVAERCKPDHQEVQSLAALR
jgi:hypothetical protein